MILADFAQHGGFLVIGVMCGVTIRKFLYALITAMCLGFIWNLLW